MDGSIECEYSEDCCSKYRDKEYGCGEYTYKGAGCNDHKYREDGCRESNTSWTVAEGTCTYIQ